jgi:hypothetical protein
MLSSLNLKSPSVSWSKNGLTFRSLNIHHILLPSIRLIRQSSAASGNGTWWLGALLFLAGGRELPGDADSEASSMQVGGHQQADLTAICNSTARPPTVGARTPIVRGCCSAAPRLPSFSVGVVYIILLCGSTDTWNFNGHNREDSRRLPETWCDEDKGVGQRQCVGWSPCPWMEEPCRRPKSYWWQR